MQDKQKTYFEISLEIQKLIKKVLNDLELAVTGEINLEHPADQSHGDYSCNIALTAFAQVKSQFSNPRELAQAIADKISSPILSKVEVAGPGFINFYLSKNWLLEQMLKVAKKEKIEIRNQNWQGKKVIVEFTDPNPFKEFHIGHLYSNTVGESIATILEANGAKVWRADYFGDVGMHAAKSIWGLLQKLKTDQLTIEDLEKRKLTERIKYLGQSYAKGATAYKDDEKAQDEIKQINFLAFKAAQKVVLPGFKEKAQVNFDQFIDKEKNKYNFTDILKIYATGRKWSLEYFESIYQRVGTKFDGYYPESRTGEFGYGMVMEGLAKGIFEKSNGAIIFPGEKYGLHDRVFINSLGLPTYETKDFGNAVAKAKDFPNDVSVIVTGNEINEYFKVVIAALKAYKKELGEKIKHIGHGMVRLPEGKMSSRTGKILTGEWLLNEAKKRVLDVFVANDKQMSETERNLSAEKVGQAAIKYAFLKSNIGDDIAFNFNESLSFSGNSGPYLQYTYVRCLSVLQKAEIVKNSDIAKPFDIVFNFKSYSDLQLNDDEIDILRNLYKYSEVVELAAREFAPHHICTYLYSLAQKYNSFYNNHKIADSEFRLLLTLAVAKTLRAGLELLGIRVVEKM